MKRHMLYHIWPKLHGGAWQWNVANLKRYIDQFDGVRSVGVVTCCPGDSGKTASLEEVQSEFSDVRIDNWIHKHNIPQLRECVTFKQLMETLPRDTGYTWYGHAKGVRHEPNGIPMLWSYALYHLTLNNESQVLRQLDGFPITGPFKRHNDFNLPKHEKWHYSGTFYWFRNVDVFQREWWDLEPTFFAGVEAWPSRIFKDAEGGCLFNDDISSSLYSPKVWEKLIPQLEMLGIRIDEKLPCLSKPEPKWWSPETVPDRKQRNLR